MRGLLLRWRTSVGARESAYDALLLKTTTFRRWVLQVQTSKVAGGYLREAMRSLEADLAGASSLDGDDLSLAADRATATTSVCGAAAAIPSAVDPSGVRLALVSAFASMSALTSRASPVSAATVSGVLVAVPRMLTSAPALTNAWTHAVFLYHAATCSAVTRDEGV